MVSNSADSDIILTILCWILKYLIQH